MLTQKHIGALLCAVWLLCGVLLLNGAVIRIPPARPSAVRVQAAGVASTGTGTAVDAPRNGLLAEFINASVNYAKNSSGVDAVWSDTSGNGYNATQSVHIKKMTASSTPGVVVGGNDMGLVVSASAFMTAIKSAPTYTIVVKQSYQDMLTGRSVGYWAFSDVSYSLMTAGYAVTDVTADATLTPKQPGGYEVSNSYFYKTAPGVVDVLDRSPHVISFFVDTTASTSFTVDGGTNYLCNSGRLHSVPAGATIFTPFGAAGLSKADLTNGVRSCYGTRVYTRLLTTSEVAGCASWTW